MTEAKYSSRRCIVCKQKIETGISPWSEVSLTGNQIFWHPDCDHLKTDDHLDDD